MKHDEENDEMIDDEISVKYDVEQTAKEMLRCAGDLVASVSRGCHNHLVVLHLDFIKGEVQLISLIKINQLLCFKQLTGCLILLL